MRSQSRILNLKISGIPFQGIQKVKGIFVDIKIDRQIVDGWRTEKKGRDVAILLLMFPFDLSRGQSEVFSIIHEV